MPADNWQRSTAREEGRGSAGRHAARALPRQGRALRRPLPVPLHEGDGRARRSRTPARHPRARSTRPSTPWAVPAASTTWEPSSPPTSSATSSASTPSPSASPSRSPWSASSTGSSTLEDTGGLDLRFGNADAMLKLVKDAAYRRGFGAQIATGSRAMSEQYRAGFEAFAMHAKGMEVGGYDPRGVQGHGPGLRLRQPRRLPSRRWLHRDRRADQPRHRPLRRQRQGPDRAGQPQPTGRRSRFRRHLRVPDDRHAGRHARRARSPAPRAVPSRRPTCT